MTVLFLFKIFTKSMCLTSREIGVFRLHWESYFIERARKMELFLSRIWEAVRKVFDACSARFFSKGESPKGLSPDKLALAEKDFFFTPSKSFLRGSKGIFMGYLLPQKRLEGQEMQGGARGVDSGSAFIERAKLSSLTQAKADFSTTLDIIQIPFSLNVRTLYLMSATASLWRLIASEKALTKDSAARLIDTSVKEADKAFFKLPPIKLSDAIKGGPSITSSIIIGLGKEKFFSGEYELCPEKEIFYSKEQFLKKLLHIVTTIKEDIAAVMLDVGDERGNFFGFSETILIDTRKKPAVFYTLFEKRVVGFVESQKSAFEILCIRRTENIKDAPYLIGDAILAVQPGYFSVIKKN